MADDEELPPSQQPTEQIPREAPNRPPPAPEIEPFPDDFLPPTEALPRTPSFPAAEEPREALPSIEELTFAAPSMPGSGPAVPSSEAAPPADDVPARRSPRPFPVGGTKVLSKKRLRC